MSRIKHTISKMVISLLIPPHVTHYPVFLDHTTPYRRFILWISTDYCNRLMESSLDYGYLLQNVTTTHNYSFSNDVITFNRIQSQIFELIEEVKSNRFGRDAKIALQVNSLLLYLNRLIYERSHWLELLLRKNYIWLSVILLTITWKKTYP